MPCTHGLTGRRHHLAMHRAMAQVFKAGTEHAWERAVRSAQAPQLPTTSRAKAVSDTIRQGFALILIQHRLTHGVRGPHGVTATQRAALALRHRTERAWAAVGYFVWEAASNRQVVKSRQPTSGVTGSPSGNARRFAETALSTLIERVEMGPVEHALAQTPPTSRALLARRCHGRHGLTLGSAQMCAAPVLTIAREFSSGALAISPALLLIPRLVLVVIRMRSVTGLSGGRAMFHAGKVRRSEPVFAATAAMARATTPAWLITSIAPPVCEN